MKRFQSVFAAFCLFSLLLSPVGVHARGEEGLILQKRGMEVQQGQAVDLIQEEGAKQVLQLNQGSFIVRFTSTSSEKIQSILSAGNDTAGNQDRHFHLYLTSSGALGMELRNTDRFFKYTLQCPAVLSGKRHGQPAKNIVAFTADPAKKEYRLYANGSFISRLHVNDYRFLRDIQGINNLHAGGTLRAGKVAYPFGGQIESVQIYDRPLSEATLLQLTRVEEEQPAIFYAEDGLESNYYRIPTLLTLSSGTVVSTIDVRYGGTHDARSNIDIGFSKSRDGGKTWTQPTLPLYFDDYVAERVTWPRTAPGKNVQISGSASFIDSVLLEDKQEKRLYLFADAYTYGRGFNNSEAGSGFKDIHGKRYLQLHKQGEANKTYNYSIREGGVIYDDRNNQPTAYSVDGNYRLLENGKYLLQKQYHVFFQGNQLVEEKTEKEVHQCIFYKDSLFQLLPTNYLAMKYSDDEGETWSDMKILGDFRDPQQRSLLYGPGVGIQLQQGVHAGRLLLTAYNSVSGDYGYIFSDDHGKNWNFINTPLGRSGNTGEAQIISLPDGSLRTYMRTNVGKIGYITSLDGGNTWSEMKYIEGLSVASYGTQISVINLSQQVDGRPAILLSTPTAKSGRRAGKLLLGLLEETGSGVDKYSVNWRYAYEVDQPAYGYSYSCLTELPDQRIGLLYEKYDSWSRDELHLSDVLKYDIFSLEEIMGK